jgi:hypothetical protein
MHTKDCKSYILYQILTSFNARAPSSRNEKYNASALKVVGILCDLDSKFIRRGIAQNKELHILYDVTHGFYCLCVNVYCITVCV